jgi:hypothetical protein
MPGLLAHSPFFPLDSQGFLGGFCTAGHASLVTSSWLEELML